MTVKHDNDWGGYTFDKLRDARKIISSQLRRQKRLLYDSAEGIRAESGTAVISILRRTLNTLNYVDYAILAINICKRLKRIYHKCND